MQPTIGSISLPTGSRHGDVYCHTETSFKEAPLSGEQLEEMERIAISFLHSCQDELELIANRVLPSNKEEDHGLSALLSKMRKMHEKKGSSDSDAEAMHSGLTSLFDGRPISSPSHSPMMANPILRTNNLNQHTPEANYLLYQ